MAALEDLQAALAAELKTGSNPGGCTQLSLPHQVQLVPGRRGDPVHELQRHYEMLYKAQRTNTAMNAMVAVCSHAQRQMEAGAEVMITRLNTTPRSEALQQFMLMVTCRCLNLMEAGVLALAESLPSRLAEDL